MKLNKTTTSKTAMDYLPLDIAKDLAHSFEKQREAGMHLTIRGSSNSQGHTPQLVNCRP